MNSFCHPTLILFLAAAIVPFLQGVVRKAFCLLVPAVALYMVFTVPHGVHWTADVLGYQLIVAQVDSLSYLFATIFAIAGFLGCMYMLEIGTAGEYAAAFFYAGSAYGLLFAGDFISLFVFWEMLTLGAATLVFARQTKEALRAGMRYILYHVVGGLLFLTGVIILTTESPSIALRVLEVNSLATLLIFLGMGVNCAWPLLHTWLVDSYPEATIGGVVFMSALTTKSAVYALTRVFPGEELLIWVGVAMAAFPIFYAVIENDLRRVLAYSLINQVGFMVVGIGLGTPLSLNGTTAHVYTHILYKSLLFMSVGAVIYRTGYSKATELGGLYRSMPITCLCCIVGAASISAFPLFSGFVSKSMVMSAAAEEHYLFVWLVLLFAAAGVFHHAGIKIPFFAFFSHDGGHRVKEAPPFMLAAMVLTAAGCIIIGCFPQQTIYPLLPYDAGYQPYTTHHVVSQLQLLFFSALAFCLLLLAGIYPAETRSVNVDADGVYRRVLRALYTAFDRLTNGINAASERLFIKDWTARLNAFAVNAPMKIARHFGSPEAQKPIELVAAAGAAPIGLPVLISVIALAAMVVFVF